MLVLALASPAASRAESSLTFWAPSALEAVGATTFDETGEAVGLSSFEVETDSDGLRHMYVRMAIDGGGSNVSQATFALVDPTAATAARGADVGALAGSLPADRVALRLVEQRSQATTREGVVYPLLVIDHRAGRVTCYPANAEPSSARSVDIPVDDRVVNVPMQLLFTPLVRGEVDTLRFQIAMCTPQPTLYKMIAARGKPIVRDGREIVQIEYGPDFGKAMTWLASRLLPSFAFWFDASDGAYLGHRMPLYREGPEVLLVRSGLTPPDIGVDP